MSTVTRDEFNAKIEAIEARMDARVESTNTRFDHFMKVQVERDRRFYEGQALRDKQVGAMIDDLADLRVEMRTSFCSLRTTVLVTAVTATIAIVLGVASFNASLTANMLAAFQLGKTIQPAVIAPIMNNPPSASASSEQAAD